MLDPGWLDLAGKLLSAVTTLGVAWIAANQRKQRSTQKEQTATLTQQNAKLDEIHTEVNGKTQKLMDRADHLVERTGKLEEEIRQLRSTPGARSSVPATPGGVDDVSTQGRKS